MNNHKGHVAIVMNRMPSFSHSLKPLPIALGRKDRMNHVKNHIQIRDEKEQYSQGSQGYSCRNDWWCRCHLFSFRYKLLLRFSRPRVLSFGRKSRSGGHRSIVNNAPLLPRSSPKVLGDLTLVLYHWWVAPTTEPYGSFLEIQPTRGREWQRTLSAVCRVPLCLGGGVV